MKITIDGVDHFIAKDALWSREDLMSEFECFQNEDEDTPLVIALTDEQCEELVKQHHECTLCDHALDVWEECLADFASQHLGWIP